MNTTIAELEFTEPERYEQREGRSIILRSAGASSWPRSAPVSSSRWPCPGALRPARTRGRGGAPVTLAQRLHIGEDGAITVFTSKVEVGQGSRTQLTQAAAEELHLPVDRVRLVMADTALGPDDGGTAGSRTTPSSVPAIRRGCAAARQLLIDTAAAALTADAKVLVRARRQGRGPARGETIWLCRSRHRDACARR